jgi:hypothetical protein
MPMAIEFMIGRRKRPLQQPVAVEVD